MGEDSGIVQRSVASTAADREKLATVVGDAVAHHPASAAKLSRLIRAIHDFGQDGPEEREQNYFLML